MALKIAATGFVEEQGGSVTSANAILLRGLLERGIEVHFFSKPSFVDPRPSAGDSKNFHFHDTTNVGPDQFRRKMSRFPIVRQLARQLDSETYERLLLRRIQEVHKRENFDLCLWFGAFAKNRISGLRTVSFAQGPPGTDARAFISRRDEIAVLAGEKTARRWSFLAKVRLSQLGLPRFSASDHFIIGSKQSENTLNQLYNVPRERISCLPYPIDLKSFYLPTANFIQKAERSHPQELKVLWLGRMVPRKRLDVFLNGAAIAIERGVPVRLTIVGQTALIAEYEKLIERFPYQDRLHWQHHIKRTEVPQLMWQYDALAQPSDEENFGSSIAEAQACGLPTIVGHTNGNADYLCPRSIHLPDDRSESFADALETMFKRKQSGTWGDPNISRQTAEKWFSPDAVVQAFVEILNSVSSKEKG